MRLLVALSADLPRILFGVEIPINAKLWLGASIDDYIFRSVK